MPTARRGRPPGSRNVGPARRRVPKVPGWAQRFIQAILTGASTRSAATAAGVSVVSVYRARNRHPHFARAWERALEIHTKSLEAEALRRAYHGTKKPVFYKGYKCGEITEYSDALLMFMLRARQPEVYRERVGVYGDAVGAVTLNVNIVNVASVLSQETDGNMVNLPAVDVQVVDANSNQQDGAGLPKAVAVP